MIMNGSRFSKQRSECRFRKTRIDKETRTSSSGRFYDHCNVTNKKCDERRCIFNTGGVSNGNQDESAD